MHKKWAIFIDVVTLIWIGVFVFSLVTGQTGGWVMGVSVVILGIYIADLVMIYRSAAGIKDFLRKAWLDLLMLIPFCRIFRICRIGRLVRSSRVFRRLARYTRQVVLMERSVEMADIFMDSRRLWK